MADLSIVSPVSPLQPRDFRSSSVGDKRSKDHNSKWRLGVRQTALHLGFDEPIQKDPQPHKIRPAKSQNSKYLTSHPKSHQNKNTPPSCYDSHEFGLAGVARMARTIEANETIVEHGSTLSASLIELLPPGSRTTAPAIHTMAADADILYSFDTRRASPGITASEVHLDTLVDQAEKKWASDQTEKMVRGEYEVLDEAGETAVLARRGKGKKSPKTKAVSTQPPVVDDEDGFELV